MEFEIFLLAIVLILTDIECIKLCSRVDNLESRLFDLKLEMINKKGKKK